MKTLLTIITILFCAATAQADDCVECWSDSTKPDTTCEYRWGEHCGHEVREVQTDSTFGTGQLEWPSIVLTETALGNPPWLIKVWTGYRPWKVTYYCETCGEFFVRYCKRCTKSKVVE